MSSKQTKTVSELLTINRQRTRSINHSGCNFVTTNKGSFQVFISSSSHNKHHTPECVYCIIDELEKNRQLQCFLAERNINRGGLLEKTAKAINQSSKWIIVISDETIKCGWCRYERALVMHECLSENRCMAVALVLPGMTMKIPRELGCIQQIRAEEADFLLKLEESLLDMEKIMVSSSLESLAKWYVDCPFGCKVRFGKEEKENMKRHLKRCRYRSVQCKNKGCDQKFLQNELSDHKKICSYQMVTCANDKCSTNVLRIELEKHLEKCFFEKIQCRNCLSEFFRKNKRRHFQNCTHTKVQCGLCQNIFWGGKPFKEHKHHCYMRGRPFMFTAIGN